MRRTSWTTSSTLYPLLENMMLMGSSSTLISCIAQLRFTHTNQLAKTMQLAKIMQLAKVMQLAKIMQLAKTMQMAKTMQWGSVSNSHEC